MLIVKTLKIVIAAKNLIVTMAKHFKEIDLHSKYVLQNYKSYKLI